jgi:hypothetical protein
VVLKLLRDKNDDDIGMEALIVVFANPIVVLVDVVVIIFML